MYPVSHTIRIINGEGKILDYEVNDLFYTGETIKDIESPQEFGHNMKVEWEEGNYYSRIFKYSNKDVGKMEIKYRVESNDFTKQTRFFDPYPTSGTPTSSWSISSYGNTAPIGMTTNGTFIWIIDATDKVFYEYTMTGTFVRTFGNLTDTCNFGCHGLATDNTYFWINDDAADGWYKYYMNGTPTGEWYNYGASTTADDPDNIFYYDGFLYVEDGVDKRIYKFTTAKVYTYQYYSLTADNGAPRGLATDGSYWWEFDYTDDEIYVYYFNWTYTGYHFDTGAHDDTGGGIAIYGSNLWGSDATDDAVYVYTLYHYPQYSDAGVNSTIAGESALFSLKVDDAYTLQSNGQYIFSTNNSGSWANDSAINFTSTPQWANVTKVLNSTVGKIIGYRWFLKNNNGNTNSTPIYTLTTTSSGYPDINYSVAVPLGVLRFLNCSPDWEDADSRPDGQTSTIAAINATNNGTLEGNFLINLTGALNTGWTIFASNDSLVHNLTLSTSAQTIWTGVAVNETKQIWLKANCSYVSSNAGQSISMWVV
jgi:hypothetical protein